MQGRIFTPCKDFLQQFNHYHHYCLVQRIKRENTHTHKTKTSPNKKNMSLFHLASTLLSPLIKLISRRAARGLDYCPNNNYRLWETSNKTSKLKTRSRPTADNEDLTSSKFITENNIVHLTIILWRIQSSSCI